MLATRAENRPQLERYSERGVLLLPAKRRPANTFTTCIEAGEKTVGSSSVAKSLGLRVCSASQSPRNGPPSRAAGDGLTCQPKPVAPAERGGLPVKKADAEGVEESGYSSFFEESMQNMLRKESEHYEKLLIGSQFMDMRNFIISNDKRQVNFLSNQIVDFEQHDPKSCLHLETVLNIIDAKLNFTISGQELVKTEEACRLQAGAHVKKKVSPDLTEEELEDAHQLRLLDRYCKTLSSSQMNSPLAMRGASRHLTLKGYPLGSGLEAKHSNESVDLKEAGFYDPASIDGQVQPKELTSSKNLFPILGRSTSIRKDDRAEIKTGQYSSVPFKDADISFGGFPKGTQGNEKRYEL